MPQRRVTCSHCRKVQTLWIGLNEKTAECRHCSKVFNINQINSNSNKAVKKSRTSTRKPSGRQTSPTSKLLPTTLSQYDKLVDRYPNIDRQIERAMDKAQLLEEQLRRRLRDDEELNKSKIEGLRKSLQLEEQELWRIKKQLRTNHIIALAYHGRQLYHRDVNRGQSLDKHLLDPNLRTGDLRFLIPSTYTWASSGRAGVLPLRRQVDKIASLKSKIETIEGSKPDGSTIRNLRYKIDDAARHLEELKFAKSQMQHIEGIIKKSQAKSNSSKKHSSVESRRGGLNWKDAEMFARDFMRQIGFLDARLTTSGRDGGVDVTSTKAIGQVKWHVAQIGSPDLQALFGIATHEGKQALFFAQRYSPDALRWGNKTQMALFRFTPSGRIEPVNAAAQKLV